MGVSAYARPLIPPRPPTPSRPRAGDDDHLARVFVVLAQDVLGQQAGGGLGRNGPLLWQEVLGNKSRAASAVSTDPRATAKHRTPMSRPSLPQDLTITLRAPLAAA